MKNLCIISFLIILSASNIFSQSGWFWQNPLPTGNDLIKIQFVNSSIVFTVGRQGSILKSTDGGINWLDLSFKDVSINSSCYFLNSQTGFVLKKDYYGSQILRTIDGGLNWNTVLALDGKYLNSIKFISATTGYCIGSLGSIVKTTNGGINWSISSTGATYTLKDLALKGNDTIFAVGWDQTGVNQYNAGMCKSTNAGLNWSLSSLSPCNSIAFKNENEIFACDIFGYILKSSNSGINWNSQMIQSQTNLYSIYFVNQTLGFICSNSRIFKTSNGGNNWSSCYYDSLETTYSLSFSDSLTGFASGRFGLLLRTINGGNNWNRLTTRIASTNLTSIDFPTSNTGFVFGNYYNGDLSFTGTILKTTNNGLNWSNNFSSTNYGFRSSNFIDNNIGYVVGQCTSGGFVMYTSNSGINWEVKTSNMGSNIKCVDFVNNETGFIVGEYYPNSTKSIYKTVNSGIFWQIIYSITTQEYGPEPISIKFIDSNTGFFAGHRNNYASIQRTTNSGVNWVECQKDSSNRPSMRCIYFINHFTGYVAGDRRTIYKTTNLGNNWKLLQTPNYTSLDYPYSISSIYFLDSNIGYATGYLQDSYGSLIDNGLILKTINGGLNWYFMNSGTNNGLLSIFFTDVNTGFVTGINGTILKTTNGGGGMIGIQHISSQVPQSFFLHQNYPNPFNPVTKIKFDIPNQSIVKLIIYDLLGREVTTLVNKQLKPGSYEVDWDGTSYASGVYFYTLLTNDFVETKRMVLLK